MEPAKKMDNQESQEAGNQAQSEDELSVEQDSVQPQRSRRRRSTAKPEIPVIMDELRELIELIREHEFTEFELEREGFRVRFRRGAEAGGGENRAAPAHASADSSQPATASPPASESRVSASAPSHPGAKAQTAASEDQDLHIIPSPIVGTFYRSPSPNAESFVKIGSQVDAGYRGLHHRSNEIDERDSG